jgi:LmbE family N-acetylglucosaminyl deacetylase
MTTTPEKAAVPTEQTLAEGAAQATPEITSAPGEAQPPPRRVLGVFAHPDDPEFFCGGTFARWAADGAHITFVLVTSGDKGTRDPDMTTERLIELREAEERRAAAALGVQQVVFLRHRDGELEPTVALRGDIVRMIRTYKPDIVVTSDPTVFWFGDRGINHSDHRVVGHVTVDAVYPAARDRLYFPEQITQEGLEPHKTRYLYITLTNAPNVKVDVTAYIDRKIAALREHQSQIADLARMEERVRANRDPESPDDAPRYMDGFRVLVFDR